VRERTTIPHLRFGLPLNQQAGQRGNTLGLFETISHSLTLRVTGVAAKSLICNLQSAKIVASLASHLATKVLILGDKTTLRSLFYITCVTAILVMTIRTALINQGDHATAAISVLVMIPVVTFGLFALAFIVLLPFGIIASMLRETTLPGASPFATDRLPEQKIAVSDPERAN
jgi:hypothetical protein